MWGIFKEWWRVRNGGERKSGPGERLLGKGGRSRKMRRRRGWSADRLWRVIEIGRLAAALGGLFLAGGFAGVPDIHETPEQIEPERSAQRGCECGEDPAGDHHEKATGRQLLDLIPADGNSDSTQFDDRILKAFQCVFGSLR